MSSYDIYMNNEKVGIANVESHGLYTLFRCSCLFHKTGTYRIHAQFGAITVDLGVCVPEDGGFLISTKIATKKLNNETPRFIAINTDINANRFVAIDPFKNFEYISKLDTAKFYVQDLKRGITFNN